MARGLLILLCLLAVTWFEFQVYPGHSYLQGETQLLVPMLERLDTPGFLSRDLVAANPTFAYTIYDEITQALHADGHLSFEQALMGQQLFFRFAALLGVFLLARELKVAPFASVVLSGAVTAITRLNAPEAFVTNREATPVAFSFSLVLLGAGFLVHRKPLLASLAGGLALLYDPVTACVFWIVMIVSCIASPALRKPMRPAWPVLVVFALILGNLIQLQAGLGSGPELTGRLSAAMLQLTRIRTPWTWVSGWLGSEIWSYLFLLVAGTWALVRIGIHSTRLLRNSPGNALRGGLANSWSVMTKHRLAARLTNWVLMGLAVSGIASVGAAMLLETAGFQVATAMPPARNLAYTIALSALVCGAASFHAWQRGKRLESTAFASLLIAAILNAQVLDLLRLKLPDNAPLNRSNASMEALAEWAMQKTWGGSMFQFPDACKQSYPGVFRAMSRRSLWADWNSGLIVDYSDQAGQEWWSRWQDTMEGNYSAERLQRMLPLHIDYYVLRRENELADIKPAYADSDYVVYDAQDLREARVPPKH